MATACGLLLGCGDERAAEVEIDVTEVSMADETQDDGGIDSDAESDTFSSWVDSVEGVAEVDAMPTDLAEVDTVEAPPCGPRADGGYDDCDFEVAPGWRSTFCDESVGRCVAPEAHCKYGWCHVPARAFRSGAGEDSATIFAFPAAISRVGRAFFIGETELPQREFERLMGYA